MLTFYSKLITILQFYTLSDNSYIYQFKLSSWYLYSEFSTDSTSELKGNYTISSKFYKF